MRRYGMTGLLLLCLFVFGAIGAASACASGSPGAAAWGDNSAGQLGNGTTTNSLDPTPVSGLTGITSLAGDKDHTLALLSTGKVMAWGQNAEGQLGNGNTTSSAVPVEVKGITTAVAIAAGGEFSLALLADGKVLAWGQNAEGQLGDGSITSSDVPVTVSQLSEVTAIAAGAKHGLALLKDGDVMGWGADGDGQLGNGTTAAGEIEPVGVTDLTGAKAIAAGGDSSFAVLSNATVEAWGANGKGQLGDASTTNSDLPVAVKGLVGALAVAAGETHTLAVTSTGSVYAWGNGASGELGNGTDTSADEPVQVTGLSEATAVAAGTNYSLALLSSGTVSAWGANGEGQLGNGSTTASDTPVSIPGIDEVKGISAGGLYGLAVGPALPTVTGVSPSAGPATGETAVTITGTGFTGVKAVHFGTASAVSYTVESETKIHATSPAGTGTVDVTVTLPGGTSPAGASDHFSYEPVVSGVSPDSGPQTGGTEVVITGVNLGGVSAVSFGANSAKSFKDESSTKVIAVSPAGVGTVNVTLTGPGGVSESVSADEFTYTSAAPELGRCMKPSKKHDGKAAGRAAGKAKGGAVGEYSDSGCTERSSEGKYDWQPGPGGKPTFKVKAGSVSLETAGGSEVTCKRAKGSGEYSGAKSIIGLQLTMSDCSDERAKCASAGAAKPGEIVTAALKGVFGVIEAGALASEDELGVDISASGSGPLLEFQCAGTAHVWRGSVIAPVKSNKMEKAPSISFASSKGHQKVEKFEGASSDVLESSTGSEPYEDGALVTTLSLKGKQEIEVNSVH